MLTTDHADFLEWLMFRQEYHGEEVGRGVFVVWIRWQEAVIRYELCYSQQELVELFLSFDAASIAASFCGGVTNSVASGSCASGV